MNRASGTCGTITKDNICVFRVPEEGRKCRGEKVFKEINLAKKRDKLTDLRN